MQAYHTATILLDDGSAMRRSWGGSELSTSWQVISAAVAELCGCDPDDVSCDETDDGEEFLTVCGSRVGVCHRQFG